MGLRGPEDVLVMKAQFEFSLPEDQEAYEIHSQALAMHAALWDFQNWLRSICKYGDPKSYDVEQVREKFFDILQENDVSI
jgi:hypothetical protein